MGADSILQLNVETALATWLGTKGIVAADLVYEAHTKSKVDAAGNFLGVIADAPDWETMIVNAEVKVTFELATAGMNDHDKAAANAMTHSQRAGKIVELFCDQNFVANLASLNASAAAQNIGFSGWEAEKPEPDGTSPDGTQLITRLAYTFEVYVIA